jgi:hypothetical protein
MKRIKLTQNKFALVDNEDYGYLSSWKWCFDKSTGYAKGYSNGCNIYMHRLVNKTPLGMSTDHINQNKLDNRRKNLRNADKRLNGINRGVEKSNKCGHKNIFWEKRRKQWVVDMRCGTKRIVRQFKKLKDAILNAKKFREEIQGGN